MWMTPNGNMSFNSLKKFDGYVISPLFWPYTQGPRHMGTQGYGNRDFQKQRQIGKTVKDG